VFAIGLPIETQFHSSTRKVVDQMVSLSVLHVVNLAIEFPAKMVDERSRDRFAPRSICRSDPARQTPRIER